MTNHELAKALPGALARTQASMLVALLIGEKSANIPLEDAAVIIEALNKLARGMSDINQALDSDRAKELKREERKDSLN